MEKTGYAGHAFTKAIERRKLRDLSRTSLEDRDIVMSMGFSVGWPVQRVGVTITALVQPVCTKSRVGKAAYSTCSTVVIGGSPVSTIGRRHAG